MKNSSNHLEMMESRTLLSTASHFNVLAFHEHSFEAADAIPFVIHFGDDHGSGLNILHVAEFDTGQVGIGIVYFIGGHHEGWFGHMDQPAAPNPGDTPSDPSHVPDSDDPGTRVAAKPSRVPRASDDPDATPADMSATMVLRDVKSVEAVSTTLLHDANSSVAHAATVISSPFASMATISVQGAFQTAKSNMIYLSFLEQGGQGDGFLASLAARFWSAVESIPSVVVRETGVAVFANGGNILSSIASPKSFEFAHFSSPLMLVADSVGSFIQASALMPFIQNTPAAATRRAWIVTAAVLGADAILLGCYYQKRRKAVAALAMETAMSR